MPGIFRETLDFMEENGVQNATFNILTPFPGTRLFRTAGIGRPHPQLRLAQV